MLTLPDAYALFNRARGLEVRASRDAPSHSFLSLRGLRVVRSHESSSRQTTCLMRAASSHRSGCP